MFQRRHRSLVPNLNNDIAQYAWDTDEDWLLAGQAEEVLNYLENFHFFTPV